MYQSKIDVQNELRQIYEKMYYSQKVLEYNGKRYLITGATDYTLIIRPVKRGKLGDKQQISFKEYLSYKEISRIGIPAQLTMMAVGNLIVPMHTVLNKIQLQTGEVIKALADNVYYVLISDEEYMCIVTDERGKILKYNKDSRRYYGMVLYQGKLLKILSDEELKTLEIKVILSMGKK